MTLPEVRGSRLVERLGRVVGCPVVGAEHEDYESARRVWNGAIDRRPAAVVRCRTVADVCAAVRLAAGEGLPVAVRGGGHGLPGFGTCDDGVVVDLSAMRGVDVDPGARVAMAEGGCTWGDYDAATQRHGLASTGGLVSTTGVGGLTLGGGIGWLTRPLGLACDNLLAVELVTATGEVVTADAGREPELFWALRGGGGNFGVVTRFDFRVHPVRVVTGGLLLWPLARADEVAAAYREWTRTLPDACTTMLAFVTGPDEAGLPDSVRGRPCVAVLGCHLGVAEEAAADLAPMRALAPTADLFGAVGYDELQRMFDADVPAGDRYYFTGGFAADLPDGMVGVLREHAAAAPSARCELHLHHMGGAAGRVGADDTAYAGRHAAYTFNVLAGWSAPAEDVAHRDWARAARRALDDFGTDGGYVNFATDVGDTADVRATYGAGRYERLRSVKRAWDPDNVFRFNQNIAP